MPLITGPKAYALSCTVVVDVPDVPDNNCNQANIQAAALAA